MNRTTKFKKGQSGNPAGRPKGITDKRTALRVLLQPHAGKLVKKAVTLALSGDVQALRICIDRIIPPVREDRLSIALPNVLDAAGCVKAQRAIVEAVAAGSLFPSEGTALSSLVENQRRSLESSDLANRLAEIETKGYRRRVRCAGRRDWARQKGYASNLAASLAMDDFSRRRRVCCYRLCA